MGESQPVIYLSFTELAARHNVAPGTLSGRKDLPREDAWIGRTRGWLPSTADAYVSVGQGARTDLGRPASRDGALPDPLRLAAGQLREASARWQAVQLELTRLITEAAAGGASPAEVARRARLDVDQIREILRAAQATGGRSGGR